MLAYDYPLLGLIWTMLVFFLFIAWIMLMFRVFVDIFRNHESSGVVKAIWSIFIIVVPFLGVFVYVIANGNSMRDRDVASARQNEAEFQSYIRETAAGGAGVAGELSQLSDLHAKGVLNDDEFAKQKAKLLAD